MNQVLKRGAQITIDYPDRGKRHKSGKATRTFPERKGPNAEYTHMGKVDITSDISFNVLKQVAEQDGLSIAFQGTQNEFLRKNGIDDFILPLANEMRTTKSLKQYIELYKSDLIYFYKRALKDKNVFHTQMLTKGLQLREDMFQMPMDQEPIYTGFKLPIGLPNKTVRARESRIRWNGCTATFIFRSISSIYIV